MKEAIFHPTPELHTTIHEVPIPTPGPNEVVVKVMVAGSNVKDWDHPTSQNKSLNSGDDVAGYIHTVGDEVEKRGEFRVGDRVGAFHVMGAPGGGYAEYAVAPMETVFKLPANVAFEEAATIPLIIATAGLTLFRRQHLPEPWAPRADSSPPLPLIIYGASGALGTFAIKLAKASNIHPIIAIAGGSSGHLAALLDSARGDALVDYRGGADAMKAAVKEKLNGLESFHAFDAISARGKNTWIPISQMLTPSTPTQTSYLSVVSGANKYDEPEIGHGVEIVYTYVGTGHHGAYLPRMPKQPGDMELVKTDPEWMFLFFRYVSRMLADGRLTGHPFEIVEGGLDGVEKGLRMLKEGKAKGVKYVYQITKE